MLYLMLENLGCIDTIFGVPDITVFYLPYYIIIFLKMFALLYHTCVHLS